MNKPKKKQFIITVNKIDLHEGDIILASPTPVDGKIIRGRLPIGWDSEEERWAVDISYHKDGSLFDALSDYLFKPDFEIIGNRYDNPKLLEY